MKILVLHRINLNMFGKRDPKQYGSITLARVNAQLDALGRELGVQLESIQTHSEGAMCERIYLAHADTVDAVLIDAWAWLCVALMRSRRLPGNKQPQHPSCSELDFNCIPCEPQLLAAP